MTDAEFLRAFQQCVLPEDLWTHRAHVRMAWLYLQQGTLASVLPIVRDGIKRYNATLNKTLAYHETITQVFLILIDDRMRRCEGASSFEEFCAQSRPAGRETDRAVGALSQGNVVLAGSTRGAGCPRSGSVAGHVARRLGK